MEWSFKALIVVTTLVQISTITAGTSCTGDIHDLPNLPLRDPTVHPKDIMLGDTMFNYYWYRAVYNGWQYIMVDSNRKPNYKDCSTYSPIYIQGTHIDVDTITETPVDATACRRDYFYPCNIKYHIKMRKCNGEIQYYLPPTKAQSAYCFEKHSQLHNKIPDPSNATLGSVTVKPELNFTIKTYENITDYMPYFKIRCDFNIEERYLYRVDWRIDDRLMVFGQCNETEWFSLHEDFFKNNNISMGFDIRCGVSVLATCDGKETDMVYSENYYVGIKVLNTTIYLKKDSIGRVQMKSTMPIGCHYTTEIEFACNENFSIFDTNETAFSHNCRGGGAVANMNDIVNQRCTNGFKTLKYGETWNPDTIYNFEIATTDMNYDDPNVFYLQLEFSDTMDHEIWRNYLFPTVKVIVIGNEAYKKKICYSHIDPHMRTSDGYYYEQQFKENENTQLNPGDFLMYRNTRYNIEVQQSTKICNRDRATCACGVAIQAGTDVFMINRCGGINYLGFPRCDDGGIIEVVKVTDYQYNIFTPIGTKITVTLYNYWSDNTMNIDITMAPKDFGNVEGLCGYFDNNTANDLRHRNGTTENINTGNSYHHNSFSESWSLNKEETRQKNLFLTINRTLVSWENQNGLYCLCIKEKSLCAKTQYINCTMANSITGTKCRVTDRKKRTTQRRYDNEMKRLFGLMNDKYNESEIKHRRTKRDDETNTISEDDAIALCRDRIKNSLAVTSYDEVTGNENPDAVTAQCAFDVMVGNDTYWATAHVESVNTIVKNMMEREPSYVTNNPEKVEIFLLNSCPGNCSNNGFCNKTGTCTCYGFYHGPDCLIDERDPLVLDDIEGGGECDVSDRGECMCFHVRSSNVLEGFKCRVNSAKINADGKLEEIASTSFSGGYEDIFTGECCFPDISGLEGAFVAKYDISLSNNGEAYGNEKSMFVFDSTCQEVRVISTDNRAFSLKPGHCFIGGYCVAENEMASAGCLACQSSVASYNWTVYNPCLNRGTCNAKDMGYSCSCAAGFEGMNCQTEIDECTPMPCQNEGTCTDLVNGYECACTTNFFGVNCSTDINDCLCNPCQNGGTCKDQSGGRICFCSDGYTGINCETNINECSPSPCVNGGICVDEINAFKCNCASGYIGEKCETEINECSSSPCLNAGSCLDEVNRYKCNCASGYTGEKCETDINECSSSPCKNGGNCVNEVNGFKCKCTSGYSGEKCETDLDECSSAPCVNGGSCEDKINGYVCKCAAGYFGVNCQTDTDDCQSNPCLNDGTCKDIVNGRECNCSIGFEGKHCETNINECSSIPCINGGTCVDEVNGYRCNCASGYTGEKCETEIKECSSSPCMNAGSCVDHVNGFKCNCVSGFTGEKCETDLDECLSAPCVNGGSCDDKINGYLCRCAAGYFGVNCQTDVNDCQSNPCLNGGSCKDNVNGRECHCSAGFDGKDCETNIDECSPNPCQNGGKCKDDINRYICVCAAGYEGNNCETDIDECVPNRCQNDGSCVDGVNHYTCTCADGYNGKDCETDIDECSTNPCQNGGSCIDGINEYICSCVRGFRGLDCEISSTTSCRISLVFPATVNNTLLSDSGIQQNVRAELITYFRGKLGQSFRDIIMLQLRHGNLIVDFVINYEHDSTAAIKLATAVTELVSGEATLEFMNEIVCATAITINNITVTAETLKTSGTLCKVYIALNGECANNMKCVVEDGSPTCVSTTSKFSLTHLIVVIVCPLVSLILVSAAVCICVRTYRVRKRKNDNDKNYDAGYDDIHGRPDMSRNCNRSPQPCSHLQPGKNLNGKGCEC